MKVVKIINFKNYMTNQIAPPLPREKSMANISHMTRITFFEGQIIESGLRVGKSLSSISKSINRDHRTIQKK
jgi:hypothetical protein